MMEHAKFTLREYLHGCHRDTFPDNKYYAQVIFWDASKCVVNQCDPFSSIKDDCTDAQAAWVQATVRTVAVQKLKIWVRSL